MGPEDAGGGGGGGVVDGSSPRRPYPVEGDIVFGEGDDDVKAGACWAELTPLPPAPPAGAEQPPSGDTAAAAAAAAAAATQPWHTDPILLTQNPFVIGRAQDAVFTTTNPAVSMRHCAVWRRRRRRAEEKAAAPPPVEGDGGEDDADAFDFYLRDYSSNGVYVNSTRVGKGRELVLREGDVLHLVRPSSAALQKYSMVYTFKPHVERAQKAATRDVRTDYYLDTTLGAGAFAEVKLGTHRSSGDKVAVKIINLKKAEIAAAPCESQQPTQDDAGVPSPSPFDIQEGGGGGGGHDERRRKRRGAAAAAATVTAARKESPREKQLREIEILKRLKHPNTVRVLEVYVSDTQCHIVMELAEGGDLFHLIKKRGSLTPVDSRTVFIQLIHAVDYLHSQGVAHRDIKPENILLARPEDVSCVKLSDFGLAKHFGSQCAELQTTCGTAMYAAPEVIHRQYAQREAAAAGAAKPVPLPYTPAVDIWSAGIVLWVMLTGRPPFPKKGVASRRMDYAAGLNFTVPPIPRVSPHLRALLTSIVRNAPAERATAAEILQNVWVREGLPADAGAAAAAAAATTASSSSSLLASSSSEASGGAPASDMPASAPSMPCIPAAKRPRVV